MISEKEKQLRDSLADKEYREALAVEHVNTTVAIQIHKMRECRHWSQSDLAEKLGKHQELISQWEDPDYGRYNIATLKAIAKAFDVALLVKFIPFSELVKDMTDLPETRLCPPNYEQDKMNWESQTILANLAASNVNNVNMVKMPIEGINAGITLFGAMNWVMSNAMVTYVVSGEETHNPSPLPTKKEVLNVAA